jgi:hypothetical protein
MTTPTEQKSPAPRAGGGGDAVYAIGLIGAWVYHFKRAGTTQERILAFFKGFVWPAFLVYDLLVLLEKE